MRQPRTTLLGPSTAWPRIKAISACLHGTIWWLGVKRRQSQCHSWERAGCRVAASPLLIDVCATTNGEFQQQLPACETTPASSKWGRCFRTPLRISTKLLLRKQICGEGNLRKLEQRRADAAFSCQSVSRSAQAICVRIYVKERKIALSHSE